MAVTLTRTCTCTGLLVSLRKPWINDFGYVCVECGRMWQASKAEYDAPCKPGVMGCTA